MSRDVKFYENVFPYLDGEATNFVPEPETNGNGGSGDFLEYVCGDEEGPLQLSPMPPALTIAGTDRDVQQPPVAPVRPGEVVEESAVTSVRPPVQTEGRSAVGGCKMMLTWGRITIWARKVKLWVVVVEKNFLL